MRKSAQATYMHEPKAGPFILTPLSNKKFYRYPLHSDFLLSPLLTDHSIIYYIIHRVNYTVISKVKEKHRTLVTKQSFRFLLFFFPQVKEHKY